MTTAELLSANLHEVFGSRDPVARRAVIEAIYTSDVTFTDPEGTVVGRDAIEAKAAAIISGAPADFTFTEASPAFADGDAGALAWVFGPADQPVARGLDIITVRDGRITSLRTLLSA